MKRVQTIDTEQEGKRRKGRGGCQIEGGSQKRTGHTGRSIKRRGKKSRTGKNRKKGRRFVPYDYERAYDQALADLDEG